MTRAIHGYGEKGDGSGHALLLVLTDDEIDKLRGDQPFVLEVDPQYASRITELILVYAPTREEARLEIFKAVNSLKMPTTIVGRDRTIKLNEPS